MKNIWVDYGSMHIERENDARLLALHYVLGNRDALQLLGVSARDDATRDVLTKLLRQAGYPAAVDEAAAAAALSGCKVPVTLLALGGTALLTVGDEEARAMGVNTTRLRLIVVICATLLTASSVAVSGMIGWVGLVIPHFCRMIFGYDYRRLVPASALFGAAFLIVVDDVARLATTAEIPLGILTAFVGAPIFIYLVLTGGGNRAD